MKSDGGLPGPDPLPPALGATGRREFANRTRRNRSISHGKSLLPQLKPFRQREPHGSKDTSCLFQMLLSLHKSISDREKKERESRIHIYPGQLEDADLGLGWADLARSVLHPSALGHPQHSRRVPSCLLTGSQRPSATMLCHPPVRACGSLRCTRTLCCLCLCPLGVGVGPLRVTSGARSQQ